MLERGPLPESQARSEEGPEVNASVPPHSRVYRKPKLLKSRSKLFRGRYRWAGVCVVAGHAVCWPVAKMGAETVTTHYVACTECGVEMWVSGDHKCRMSPKCTGQHLVPRQEK